MVTSGLVESVEYTPGSFFALRTPLLPWDTIASHCAEPEWPRALSDGADLEGALARDRARETARLRDIVADPVVREALFVASPTLDEAVEAWTHDQRDERARGVVDILVRYVARMAARATPFGLFSGCSLGAIGDATRLELAPRNAYRRHTRLDAHYLTALTEALHREPGLRAALMYRPSSGLYAAADQLRYAEGRTDPTTRDRRYHLVSVERTDYLDAVLGRAREGARLGELTELLVAREAGIEHDEALGFVESLVESQILVSDLAPPITGSEPLAAIIDVLRGCGEDGSPYAELLAETSRAIEALDRAPLGSPLAQHRDVAKSLGTLPAEPELARLFHVDLYKPVRVATLGGEPLREIERAVRVLSRVAPRGKDEALERFRTAFAERWGERVEGPLEERQLVPLALALDEEIGIGFGESADHTPLLDGLELPPDPASPSVPFGRREERLLRGLSEALRAGRTEWTLGEDDLVALEAEDAPGLPDAFAVMTTLAARDEEALARGDFRVIAPIAGGPSGAIMLGRFCHGDPELRRAVEGHLRDEEALRPEAIFAEIVHLPEGRLGNILCRPLLRDYEIPFLGRSGARADRQLPLDDLYVTLANGRIVLWSQRLGREVIPRLTSAHNFTRDSLGVYRFLCALQSERERNVFAWSWGPLASAPFLPRVTYGRIVLAHAQYNLDKNELAPIASAKGAGVFRAVQDLRARRGLPRWVALVEHDNVLPVDLDNVLSVESWARLVKGRTSATMRELLAEDELFTHGPEGRFTHELVVPFVRVPRVETPGETAPAKSSPHVASARTEPRDRTFTPGSEWLYAKLYTGSASADAILAEVVRPLLRAARAAKELGGWFFVRYADPHWHLRVRLRGDPRWLTSNMLPMLHERVEPHLASGRVWRVELATYEREIERYGGIEGIGLAEALFEADSEAVLSLVEQLEGDEGSDARWRLALRGCHLLLVDLGLDLPTRAEIVRQARASFGAEHHVDKRFERALGMRFRGERAALEALLSATPPADHPLALGFEALAARSDRLRPIVAELRAREVTGRVTLPVRLLAASFMHMHCNRLLRTSQRTQELVIYDWLVRLYEAEAARSRRRR